MLIIKALTLSAREKEKKKNASFLLDSAMNRKLLPSCLLRPRGRLVPSLFPLRPARLVMQGQRTFAGNNKRATYCAIVSTAVFPNSTASFRKVHVTDGSLAQASKFTRKGHVQRTEKRGWITERRHWSMRQALRRQGADTYTMNTPQNRAAFKTRPTGEAEARVNEIVV